MRSIGAPVVSPKSATLGVGKPAIGTGTATGNAAGPIIQPSDGLAGTVVAPKTTRSYAEVATQAEPREDLVGHLGEGGAHIQNMSLITKTPKTREVSGSAYRRGLGKLRKFPVEHSGVLEEDLLYYLRAHAVFRSRTADQLRTLADRAFAWVDRNAPDVHTPRARYHMVMRCVRAAMVPDELELECRQVFKAEANIRNMAKISDMAIDGKLGQKRNTFGIAKQVSLPKPKA